VRVGEEDRRAEELPSRSRAARQTWFCISDPSAAAAHGSLIALPTGFEDPPDGGARHRVNESSEDEPSRRGGDPEFDLEPST
jgi:hypothetical protein